jgi:hypothetical protein
VSPREKARRQKQREEAGTSEAEQRAASILGAGKLLRFRHLNEIGLVNNWTTLIRWIKEQGFPPGRIVGVSRVWFESEIDQWIASRPVASDKPLKGGARDPSRAQAARRLKREQAAQAASPEVT